MGMFGVVGVRSRARLQALASAGARPKPKGIAQGKARSVAAEEASTRQGNVHLPVKLQFLRHDPVVPAACYACEDLIR